MKSFCQLIILMTIIAIIITNCSREEQHNTEEQTEQISPQRKITPDRYYIEDNEITTVTTNFADFENEEESAIDSGQIYTSSRQILPETEQTTDFDSLNSDN